MQIDFLQSVVDRRTGNQVVLLGEVDPRETVKTSFWTPAFFRSWSVWMGVVLLDHCQGDQNNFCLSSLFGWGLLYRTRAFARGYLGVLLLHLSYLSVVTVVAFVVDVVAFVAVFAFVAVVCCCRLCCCLLIFRSPDPCPDPFGP